MNGMKKISHKELLTFSNLTNLEWEFVDLEPEEETASDGSIYYEYKKLNDLLDPENFVRYDTEGNFEKYVYMENVKEKDEISTEDKEEGLKEMRKRAGIAMEYLEKLEAGNEEGAFLQDWEVINGADKYKLIK